ncbi:hypothetical protein Cmaq_1905 [Caldivirga maquilingensis IC-167]|uniref:Uncharacterized protein n=2 Tax=Caldivirga maquilingensis TaxID=76887 RepID=A8MBI9_CALMQ|nr:hypothetical protein Cmaq_1905 [Caldivirga maquilingensis IC-167]
MVVMEEKDDSGSKVKLVEDLLRIVNDEVRGSFQGIVRDLSGAFTLFKDTYGFNTSYVDLSEGGLIVLESVCSQSKGTGNESLNPLIRFIGLNPSEGSTYPFTVSLGLLCMPSQESVSYQGEGPGVEDGALYFVSGFSEAGVVGDLKLYCARRVIVKPGNLTSGVNVNGEDLVKEAAKACREFRESHSDLVKSFSESFGLEPAEVVEIDEGSVGVDLPLSLSLMEPVKALASRLKSAVSEEAPSLMLLGLQCTGGEGEDYVLNASEDGVLVIGKRQSNGCLRYFMVK